MKTILLNGVLSSERRTKFAARILRVYQRSGLQEAVNESVILSLFSETLQAKHAMLPKIAERFFDESVPEVIPAIGEKRGRVAFLSGCIMNVTLPDIHHDVVDVLIRNGYEVVVPKQQGCCGALHAHYGETENAKQLAKKNIDLFEKYEFDALILDSAGCSAFLKEYAHVFYDDEVYSKKAAVLALKTKDITEFLSEVGFIAPQSPAGFKPEEELCVTYHEACHLVHTQKISQQPKQIIKSIPGLEIVELPEATWCCGSAGIYNAVRFDDSMQLLERKMKNLQSTNADIVITANPGCHLQLQYGINKFGVKMKVMHPVSLLLGAYNEP
jgi:glycolate oxidase iron-sulfur subunit